jgi:DNA polymerase-3 subunit delta
MKLKAPDVARFVARPDPKAPACLIYGSDTGLVRERSNVLATHKLGNLKDNFGLVDLAEADLKNDPARLADEICSISMLADARVVRVQGAGEATAKVMTGVLAELDAGTLKPEAFVIIEAGDLAPRSKLRKLFEGDASAVALACYPDEGHSLEVVIQGTLREARLEADPAAMAAMMDHLGTDRALTRSELEKLLLFKGAFHRDFKSGRITLADVEASMGSGSASNIDGVIDAALTGHFDRLDKELQAAKAENLHPTVVLRGLQNHLNRLIMVRTQMDNGGNLREVMKGLRPPVFFKRQQTFSAQVGKWPSDALKGALGVAVEAEIQCKRTGQPDKAICAHALMSVASRARRLRG